MSGRVRFNLVSRLPLMAQCQHQYAADMKQKPGILGTVYLIDGLLE